MLQYRLSTLICIWLICICCTFPSYGQSDEPCSATSIPVNSSCSYTSGTNVGATDSPGVPAPGCAGYLGGDVWYTVTVPASGIVLLEMTAGGVTDAGMAVYSGTCSSLALISCNDLDGPANMPQLFLQGQTPGTVLYIRIWEDGNNVFGTFNICAIDPSPPANDSCGNATALATNATCTYSTATNLGATGDVGVPAPGCANYISNDIWYTVTVPATGNLLIETATVTNGAINDAGMAVYSGTCGALSLIECDDADGPGAMPQIQLLGQTPGTVLYVRLWEDGNNSFGDFNICATELPASPSNDLCANAIPLPVGVNCTYTTGTTLAASGTATPAPGCAFYNGGEVWYSIVVPAGGSVNIETASNGGMGDSGLAAYSGTCGSLTLLACDDDGGTGLFSLIELTGLTPGSTIYVCVWEYGNDAQGSFDICAVEPPPPPLNDDCANAIALPVNSSCVNTSATNQSATASTGIPAPGCTNYQGGDVWFTVTVPAGGNITVESTAGVITDGGMAIYSGTCGALSLLACDDDSGAGLMPSITLYGQTPGDVLYVRMWEDGNNNNGTFDICATIAPPPPAPPANDDCLGALPVVVNTSSCTSTTPGTVVGATASTQSGTGCAGFEDDDVWFSFVAPTTGAIDISLLNVAGSTTDLTHSIWEGTCPSLTLVPGSCSDPNNSTNTSLIAGNTYYLRVSTYTGSANQTTTFDVCIVELDACGGQANNDFCQAPATLTQGPGTFSSSTASLYTPDTPGNMIGPFCGSIENNSWYQFTALSTTEVFNITSVTGCTQGIQALVYEVTTDANGCCVNFTSPSNCYGPGSTTLGTVTATGLTIGNTYIFMVDGFAGANCDFTVENWLATGILPVELVNFYGVAMPDANILRWQTASELNNDYFIVSRSFDGIEFEEIGTVKGIGNSSSLQNYLFEDGDIRTGIVYYQLTQVDFDGASEESEMIALDRKNLQKGLIGLYPNPSQDFVFVEVNASLNSKLELRDARGQLITQKTIETNSHIEVEFSLSNLESGIYFTRLILPSGLSQTKKIIKN